jgi:acyl carrier protein
MKVTRAQILKLLVDAGIPQEVVSTLKPGVPLTDQGIDSVDFPAVLVAVKEKYGVAIDDKEASRIRTLIDMEKRLNR